jgi:hypothetical protein
MALYQEINAVLMHWNPIGVSGSDLETEYVRYIEELILCVQNKGDLLSLIHEIEGNRIGFFYTREEDREWVAKQLLELFKESD